MRHLTTRHAGIAILLVVYFAALFYLVPIFARGLLEPGIGNKAIHFAITYAMATFSTYFSRLFYVSDVSFRFELAAGLVVAFVFFVLIGQPRMKLAEPRRAAVPRWTISASQLQPVVPADRAAPPRSTS